MSRSPPASVADVPGLRRLDRLTRRVLGVALVAALLRLVLLGARVSHYDEGRVGWWTLHFLDTGQFEYRYIIHGPFVQHVDRVVFALVGANDVTMRLVVAVAGSALPLAALLFREHLDDDETLGVAAFLAVNPVLVYYSRFFRSTLLVAAFSFVAFGLLVRAVDERSVWRAQGAVAFVALAFAAKENAAVYLLCWAGGLALLADHALFRTGSDESGVDWVRARLPPRERLDHYRSRWLRYVGHLALGGALFVAVSLFFYAPRSPDASAVGLWQGVTNPTQFPTVLDRTLDDVVTGYEYWFGGSTDPVCRKDNVIDGYLCFLGRSVETLKNYALPLMVLSVTGFLAERWGRPRSRWLVLFAGYWGFVSVLGYPLGTDIYGGWITVNALVPLTIPAGVGLALVWRWTRDALHGDALRFGVAAFVVFLVVGLMAQALVLGVYVNPTGDGNELVQYAQPADDFRPAMRPLDGRASTHEGADVLVVGSDYVRDSKRNDGIEPLCTSIRETLPLQWYIEAYGAEGECAQSVSDAAEVIESDDPIVVIAPASYQSRLSKHLDGYDSAVHRLRTRGRATVFFTDRGAGSQTADGG
ncbi:MAG: flippase activity-associated protein Agl23 [Haloarculaceae archaeon]